MVLPLAFAPSLHRLLPPDLVYSPRDRSRHTLLLAETNAGSDDGLTLESLGAILQRRRKDLLASPPPPSLSSNNLHPDALSRQTLLNTRMDLALCRTRIGPSSVIGAGRGLFATRSIDEGEIVTCYPGDAVLWGYEQEEHDEDEESGSGSGSGGEKTVVWGEHVDQNLRWDDAAVFDGGTKSDGTTTTVPLRDYVISVDDDFAVMGLPILDANLAYAGHFVNDAAGGLVAEGLEAGEDVEDAVISYVLESMDSSNVVNRVVEDCHMVTVACRDIGEGEEIFVSYGPDYWRERSELN